MMDSIILTGSTGFLGNVILNKLTTHTDYHIITTMRKKSGSSKPVRKSPRISPILTSDLDEYCQNPKIKILGAIHAATEYGRSGQDISKVLDANIALPVVILKVLSKKNSHFFINAESFYNKSIHPYPYLMDYITSKKALHYWLELINDYSVINLFLEHMYGPGDSRDKFIPTLFSDLKNKSKQVIEMSPGDQIRDFIHVEDVADAFLAAINFGLDSKLGKYSFEIGTGVGTTIRELAQELKRITRSNSRLEFGKLAYRENEIKMSIADVQKNQNLIWHAKISLHSGLVRLNNEQ
jgi:nucleoside-diphosphate-sugar epimerase